VAPFAFPNGKRFAFTIVDDTDVATVENVLPMYRLLEELGMRTTKTVWPVACPEGSPDFGTSQTLDDAPYREFLTDLQRRGFELTWHGATMESSQRERTIAGLERFREVFGAFPAIHVSHSFNRENLYWGPDRVDVPLLRWIARSITGVRRDYFQGHVEGSPYWWGDLCSRHIVYARNLTFNHINTTAINPSLPYRDPSRPIAPWWFSSSDAENAEEFADLLSLENQERLETEGGVCIVATHIGKEFVQDGRVRPLIEERLRALARRPGWFVPVGPLLDSLRSQRASERLPPDEWRRMQWRWFTDLAFRKIRRGLRRRLNAVAQTRHL
jgi:hypothetical protein